MKRRTYLAACSTGALTALAGCGAVDAKPPCADKPCDVGMSSNAYLPREIEVSVGDTVTWRNTSSRPHTVTAIDGGIPDEATYFASGGFGSEAAANDGWSNGEGGIEIDDTFEHTFEVPGEYQYYCIPHVAAGMEGSVVVTE